MSANSKSKSRKRNRNDTELTTVPDKGEICKNNENTHVGDDENIEDIKEYIKDNIIWYISTPEVKTSYDIDDLFKPDDEGLLKYIRLILNNKATTIQKNEIDKLLKSKYSRN